MYVTATVKPILWAVGNPVIEAGVTQVGEQTITGLTMFSDSDEGAFLGKVIGKAAVYKPLPTTGTIEAGMIYGYNNDLVICRQTHQRTIYAPIDTPALFCVYRADGKLLDWVTMEKVLKGMQRVYNSKTYTVLQDHVTQPDWTPDKTPALWALVSSGTAWAYPVAYKINDLVTYDSATYKCLQAHTSQSGWYPPAVPALWKQQ